MFIKQLKNKTLVKLATKLIKNFLSLSLILVLQSAYSFASPDSEISIIAKIDNEIITNVDLLDRYKIALKISKIQVRDKQERQVILDQVLQKIIDEELQIKEANALGIAVGEEQLIFAQAEIAKNLHIKPKQLSNFFAEKSLVFNSLLKQLKAEILWSEIIKKNVASKIKINQAEIDELLESRKVKTNIDKYFIAEIFIPLSYQNDDETISSKDLAQKLFDELKKGKNFNNIVKQFSRSPTAEFGGEIGWVGFGDVNDKIYQAILQTKLGEVSDPVLINDGYYIFKVINKKSFELLSEQDKNQVKNIIFSKKLKLEAKNYLMNLRNNSYVEINRGNLENLERILR